MHICGRIFDNDVQFLIDSGASVSIISPVVFSNITEHTNFKLEQSNVTMTAADGNVIKCFGTGLFTIEMNGIEYEHQFWIAEISMDAILGFDFLKKNKCIIDFEYDKLLMDELPNSPYNTPDQVYIIAATQTMTLPAESETIIPAHFVTMPTEQLTGIIQPTYEFVEKNEIAVANALVSTKSKNVIVRLLNPHQTPKRIHAGMKIGTLEPVNENEIIELSDTQEKCNNVSCKLTEDNDNTPIMTNTNNNEIPSYLDELWSSSQEGLNPKEQNQARTFIIKNQASFAKSKNDMGLTNLVQHKIYTGDAAPVRLPARRVPIHQRQVERDEIDSMLKRGVIEPSDSPWRAAMVLVPKKGDSKAFRSCIDYRALNQRSRVDSYPLARIDTSLDHLSGAKWFSTLDLQSGYWQVAMAPEDKEKTAFMSGQGQLYQFTVMPFGLASAPATFQRLMEKVLANEQYKTCLVYLDDVITYSTTFEQGLERLQTVLDRIKAAGLKLNPKKCHFFKKSVAYLGHVVSENGVSTDPEKVRTVQEWPTPRTVTHVRSFLGLCSYYRRYISGFSKIAKPLHLLTEKNRVFEWSQEAEEAFQSLKQLMTSAPILAYPSETDEFILDTDASNFHLGAVLSQVQDGHERPVAYFSRTLNKAECNYCITRKELLAIVASVKHFHAYLYGQKFKVRTDHGALTWLMKFKHPEAQVARWIEVLDTYDFVIEHRAGRSHGNADALSRRPCEGLDCKQCSKLEKNMFEDPINVSMRNQRSKIAEQDNPTIMTIQTNEFSKKQPVKAHVDAVKIDNWVNTKSKSEIRQAQLDDPIIGKILRQKEGQEDKPPWCDISNESPQYKAYWTNWPVLSISDGVLYMHRIDDGTYRDRKGGQVLVLPTSFRRDVLQNLHNARVSGHLGRNKTLGRVRERYYWVGYAQDVANWCRKCAECQRKHRPKKSNRAPMKIYNVGAPLERMAMDVMGPFPVTTRGNRYILCIGDYFSKWVTAIALPNQEASTIATALIENVFTIFGLPNTIHSDLGTNFQSQLMTELCELLDIEKTRSSRYKPTSNGFIERINRTIQSMLARYVSENQTDWDVHLQYVMLAYRSSTQETTGFSPNELMLGRNVKLPVDIIYGQPPQENCTDLHEYVQKQQEHLTKVHDVARQHMNIASEKHKRLYDHHSKPLPKAIKVGDHVWYYCPVRKKGISPKLQTEWKGPYVVNEKLSDILFRIKVVNPKTQYQRKGMVIHSDKLKLIISPDINTPVRKRESESKLVPVKTKSGREVTKPRWYGIPN